MATSGRSFLQRSWSLSMVGLIVVVLAACTGRGGGTLPPHIPFTGPASFGFSFSCERSSNSTSTNPPTGRLRIQISYTDHGTSPIGSPFSIHGVVDEIDPVLESMICIGQEPPPGVNELIFLGRYRVTSSPPAGVPKACAAATTPSCRFEVIVRDGDDDRGPSLRDWFSISLSGSTAVGSELGTVFYARAGRLDGGNLTVD